MAEQTIKILENKDEDIENIYVENITIDKKSNTIHPIKILEIQNNTDNNYKTLNQNRSNYLKNLEIYKNLPDSIITNIIKSRRFICKNHNILFHHYSKEKKTGENNSKNSGRIQSIIINTNLKSLNKEKKLKRTLSNNSHGIYHKKKLIKSKRIINSNKLTKKNQNISQSSIIANYETNYDYDLENNYNNEISNYNYINFSDNSEKLNLFERKNYFTDITLKDYLNKEIKSLVSSFYYSENKIKSNDKNKEKSSIENIKNKEKRYNSIQTIQHNLNIKSNIMNYLSEKKIARNNYDTKLENKIIGRYTSYSCLSTNPNCNINHNIKSKNRSQENLNTYSNLYKIKKAKKKVNGNIIRKNNNNNFLKLLITKSFNQLSNNGNFTTINSKRKIFKEEEKNNKKMKRYNVFINTQKFYNDSKIDYISFRKNNLRNLNDNKNNLKLKKENKKPLKLYKKDLNIISESAKRPLIIGIKSNYKTKRNSINDEDKNKIKNYKNISEPKIDKNKKKYIKLNNKALSYKINENKKEKSENKKENNKKKIFQLMNEWNKKNKDKKIIEIKK